MSMWLLQTHLKHLEIFEGAGTHAGKGQPLGRGCLGFHKALNKALHSPQKPWKEPEGLPRAVNRLKGNNTRLRNKPELEGSFPDGK